jgi:hypothetical protein
VSNSRTVIVCMPADQPLDWFSASEILDWHKLPAGTPHTMFPVRRPHFIGRFSRWSARHLVQTDRRFGAVTHAAGGRKSRLDLTAAVTQANAAAVYRWRTWAQVVRTTPVARTWGDFLAQHKANPSKVSMEEATRRFEEQPRVLAMLAFNSHPVSRVELDPYELDATRPEKRPTPPCTGSRPSPVTRWSPTTAGCWSPPPVRWPTSCAS